MKIFYVTTCPEYECHSHVMGRRTPKEIERDGIDTDYILLRCHEEDADSLCELVNQHGGENL